MKGSEIRYRIGVVGSLAGFAAWALGALIPIFVTLPADYAWVAELLDSVIVGLCIGAFGSVLTARISQRKAESGRLLLGILGGLAAGVSGSGLSFLLRAAWSNDPVAGIVLAWSCTGALIGFVLGLIRHGRQWLNVLLATIGGGLGATIGGAVLVLWGDAFEYVTRAAGLMFTGAAICVCAEYVVWVARRATLRFVGSPDPSVGALLAGLEWELMRRTRVLFIRSGEAAAGVLAIRVPDPFVAPRHAWIEGQKQGFRLFAHDENIGPNGLPVWTLEAGAPPTTLRGACVLCHGDEIVVGRARFRFESGRTRRHHQSRAGMASVAVLWLLCGRIAMGESGRLVPAEGPRLLRAAGNVETPVFSAQLNILDAAGRVVPVPVLSPARAREAVRVSEAGADLSVCHVSLGALPERRAILLVDVSGSMLERVSDGQRKFDVMQTACRRFSASFEDGIDRVAVIPFQSHGVADAVRRAQFESRAEDFGKAVNSLPIPKNGNTGLYSAVIEALARIRQDLSEHQRGAIQYLLVVLTDGKNDVRAGDDPGLERSLDAVRKAVAETDIQVITIGFGTPANLNEGDLKRMAWPSSDNYLPAEHSADVLEAFTRARALQVQRLSIVFQPRQRLISQLVSPHRFAVSFLGITGSLEWLPRPVNVAEGEVEPCGTEARRGWFGFLTVLFAGLGLHWALWRWVPRWRWGAWNDVQILRGRAEKLWIR